MGQGKEIKGAKYWLKNMLTSIGWSVSILMTLPSKVGNVFLFTLFTFVVEHVPPWGLLLGCKLMSVWLNDLQITCWSFTISRLAMTNLNTFSFACRPFAVSYNLLGPG